ncbi:hypothetical protein ACFXKI_41070, partial [Streptomyces mirabilis]
RQAADQGDVRALARLALLREEAGDREGAEALVQQAAGHGDIRALYRLAVMREEAGDCATAEALYRQAADHGTNDPHSYVAELPKVLSKLWPYGLDPDGTPTPPW